MKESVKDIIFNKVASNQKLLAILVDPDKAGTEHLRDLSAMANTIQADFFLIGGSLLTEGNLDDTIALIQKESKLPIVIFPGSSNQISSKANAILFLSLLSSRNPEMLIGQQVVAAPYVKKAGIEAIPTAYLLIDSGTQTTASYMSNSSPIPADKPEIAASTALAGEYLGMKLIYLDGGSGAKFPVSPEMISKVKEYTTQPIIVGGGINTIEKLTSAYDAGADIAVIGNAFETNLNFSEEVKTLVNSLNSQG